MMVINDCFRLEEHQSYGGPCWVCMELMPRLTVSDREVWKPITKPMRPETMMHWLRHRDAPYNSLVEFSKKTGVDVVFIVTSVY